MGIHLLTHLLTHMVLALRALVSQIKNQKSHLTYDLFLQWTTVCGILQVRLGPYSSSSRFWRQM